MMEFQVDTNVIRRFNTTGTYRLTRMYSKARDRVHATSQSTRRHVVFLLTCLAVILSVSMVDVYWSFKTQDILYQTEQNPIGSWLIQVDQGDVALFMTLKMLGNLIVVLAIPALYVFKKRWGLLIAGTVASFQIGLFLYLNFGHLLNRSW